MTENPSFVTSMLFTLICFLSFKNEKLFTIISPLFCLMQPPHGSIIYNQKNIKH